MLNPVDFGLEGQNQAAVSGKQHGRQRPVHGEQGHDEQSVTEPIDGHGQAVDMNEGGDMTGVE